MKENQLKNETVGVEGGGGENFDIAFEIHMKETGVLIMQFSRLDKMICYATFVMISLYVLSAFPSSSSVRSFSRTTIPTSS